jgi:hypothetical protein
MALVTVLSLTAVGSSLRSDEQQPETAPTRDVDITYQITWSGQPAIVERRRWSLEKGTALKGGRESQIAGLTCIDWSWMDDTEMHTACLTEDGVLLRLVIDDLIVAKALTVLYAQQPPELFEVPPGYEPALAPQGGPGE